MFGECKGLRVCLWARGQTCDGLGRIALVRVCGKRSMKHQRWAEPARRLHHGVRRCVWESEGEARQVQGRAGQGRTGQGKARPGQARPGKGMRGCNWRRPVHKAGSRVVVDAALVGCLRPTVARPCGVAQAQCVFAAVVCVLQGDGGGWSWPTAKGQWSLSR